MSETAEERERRFEAWLYGRRRHMVKNYAPDMHCQYCAPMPCCCTKMLRREDDAPVSSSLLPTLAGLL